ncbi:hypothetical protein OX283_014765 [Flavobacterium sp. SUN052]|uniref:hypothetical protein n=1 Tax=Flavobacterium sp. SUN052 TaxID=3002441 RepID=UPI00237D8764|nr:hypothetical protein [Flavobacterium sp. SUN052]MEC4005929.1 hypothetical protein [Flavobacterium sp. SUN052]
MTPFTIQRNNFLTQNIQGFYHTDFGGVELPNNPNFLYKLKNDPHHNWSALRIQQAQQEFRNALIIDLPAILAQVNKNSITVCVVPRAKAENTYRANQLLFKSTIKLVVETLAGFNDGTNYIQRHTNTKTTHIRQPVEGFNNDGLLPYVGITNATCHISDDVIGKDILLIDDIYTRNVNIDEDAIQALLTKGASSVTFYAIGNTVLRH